jgi:Structure-specific recognition protein (SSRP1)
MISCGTSATPILGRTSRCAHEVHHVLQGCLCCSHLQTYRTGVSIGVHDGVQEVAMSASGRNWGDAVVDNETLQFSVGSKPLFSVALPDVTQVSGQGVMLPEERLWHLQNQAESSSGRGNGCSAH